MSEREIAESRSEDLRIIASDLVTNYGFDLPLLEGAIWAALEAERARLSAPQFLANCIEAVGMVGKEAVDEAVAAERERCAKIAELYADVSWEKCTDSILLDPVLSNRGRRPLTSEDWKRAEDMAIDGTISSAAYHAANHIATSIRQGSPK